MLNNFMAAPAAIAHPTAKWYAIHTRARHEKKAAAQLAERGITAFAATTRTVRQWSDRRQEVEVPLFSSYVFVQVERWRDVYYPVLNLPSVLRWVRLNREEPSVLPDSEIDAVRAVSSSRLPLSSYPYLNVGQRVRVKGGCLDGVEGILVGHKTNATLVLSVHLLQQSIAISVDGYRVEAA